MVTEPGFFRAGSALDEDAGGGGEVAVELADPIDDELADELLAVVRAGDCDADVLDGPEQPARVMPAAASATADSVLRDGHMPRERIRFVG